MIPSLTGLRALALVIIVLGLASAEGYVPGEFLGFEQVGFMLVVTSSGFMLALRYGVKLFRRRRLLEFVRQRSLIIPGYWLVLIGGLAVAHWWVGWPYQFTSISDFVRAVLFVAAPGPLWVVPVLVQCSVVFVAVWWLWSRGTHVGWIAALVIATTVPAWFGWGLGDQPSVSVVSGYFFAGVALGIAWPLRLAEELRHRARAVSIGGSAALLIVAMNLPALRSSYGLNLSQTVVGSTWLDPVTGLAVLALIVTVAAQPRSLEVFAAAPLRAVGRLWYPVYLGAPIAFALLP